MAGVPLLLRDSIRLVWFYQKWGLFDQSGRPVVVSDAVTAFEFKRDWSIADYPLEEGAFESYNKVQTPYDVRLTFAAGTFDARQQLLSSLGKIEDDLKRYSAVTPEKTYPSVNVSHVDYRRTASSGVGLMKVDVWLTQIRVTVATAFGQTDVASPSSASPVDNGQVEAGQPKSAAQQLADGEIPL